MTTLVEKVGWSRRGTKAVALRSYSSAGACDPAMREKQYCKDHGHVAHMGESKNAYRVLVGGPEGKRPLGRPRRRWEDNIKMGLREVGYDDRDWINLAQDRDQWRAYVRAAMNIRVLKSQQDADEYVPHRKLYDK
ncbi:hypothetical protein ANN_22387 [Periplaneta americana]|uniref:Uncharacterized protein n=1 Tax=Periplaneta americana TaxID=6978 RepID=A0ABQ8S8Z9_PERAM|nr:hypothetical protein ANN_22387 [Periplaneta americana]